MKHWRLWILALLWSGLQIVSAADQLEFMNGTKVTGTLVTFDNKAKQLTFDFTFNGQNLKRTFPYAQVHTLTWKGKRTSSPPKPPRRRIPPTPLRALCARRRRFRP